MFNRIRGRHGEVTISGVGAVVGKYDGEGGWWEIIRREDGQQPGKPVVYRFRAVLSYLGSSPLWDNPRLKKVFTLKIQSKLFRLEPVEEMVRDGRRLQSEGVTLWEIEKG